MQSEVRQGHQPPASARHPPFPWLGVQIVFYVGSRGHHADVGGITPGSMPSNSTHIEEEGVLFDNFVLVRGPPPVASSQQQ